MKKLLRGGTVINASGRQAADVLIDGEKIAAVAPGLSCADAEVIDVSGKLLFPGFIDAHTHFDLDVCNTTTADDFCTGIWQPLRTARRHDHDHRLCLPEQGRDSAIRP